MTVWNQRDVLARLHAVVVAVPPWDFAGSQSATVAAIASAARDMATAHEVVRLVLLGAVAPAPHPTFGDDGHRDDRRTAALEALAWGERWAAWRSTSNWYAGQRCRFGEEPWGT